MLSVKNINEEPQFLNEIKRLFQQYIDELNEDLCFQHLDEELDNPLIKYGPPGGSLLLAFWNNEPAGCVALQPIDTQGICEMKRLYIKPAFRKHGIGESLVQHILNDAAGIGYNKMVLDTLARLTPATRLYAKYGFVSVPAYYFNPLPGVVYMEKYL